MLCQWWNTVTGSPLCDNAQCCGHHSLSNSILVIIFFGFMCSSWFLRKNMSSFAVHPSLSDSDCKQESVESTGLLNGWIPPISNMSHAIQSCTQHVTVHHLLLASHCLISLAIASPLYCVWIFQINIDVNITNDLTQCHPVRIHIQLSLFESFCFHHTLHKPHTHAHTHTCTHARKHTHTHTHTHTLLHHYHTDLPSSTPSSTISSALLMLW